MLKGKIIINTRPLGSEDLIGNALEKLGAIVLSMPLIEIFQIPVSKKTLSNITKKDNYQWVVFTSKNGVEYLFNQLDLAEKTKALPFKTAVFGERTAKALQDKGFNPTLVVEGTTSADLLNELLPKLQIREKVLLVLGDLSSNILEDGLKSKVDVDRLNIYRTEIVKSVEVQMITRVAKNDYDLILFTSPSGFNSFLHHTTDKLDLNKLKIACLGPTTEEKILSEGLVPLVVAKPSGKAGILKGMEEYFSKVHV